jgi:hypothetical protein
MLDMIEFPHTDFPLQIAVCPSTGNFMVCFISNLSLGHLLSFCCIIVRWYELRQCSAT